MSSGMSVLSEKRRKQDELFPCDIHLRPVAANEDLKEKTQRDIYLRHSFGHYIPSKYVLTFESGRGERTWRQSTEMQQHDLQAISFGLSAKEDLLLHGSLERVKKGTYLHVKMEVNEPLKKAFQYFCNKHKLDINGMVFKLGNREIKVTESAENIFMKQQDIIYIYNRRKLPESNFCEQMWSMYKNGEFTDVCLVVEGKKFNVHKAFLSARSEKFRALFRTKLKESEQKTISLIQDRPGSAEAFALLLEYLYTDTVRSFTEIRYPPQEIEESSLSSIHIRGKAEMSSKSEIVQDSKRSCIGDGEKPDEVPLIPSDEEATGCTTTFGSDRCEPLFHGGGVPSRPAESNVRSPAKEDADAKERSDLVKEYTYHESTKADFFANGRVRCILQILYHTDLLNAEALKDHCFGIIIENYGETLYGEQVKSLPKPLILELLQRFAESRNPNLKKRRSRDGDDSSGSTRGSTKRRAPYRKVRFDVAADPI
eukprot:jgi/Bigna1/86770/estExt_fgenesh1_pg.C_130211